MTSLDFQTCVWLATAVCGVFTVAGAFLAPTFGSGPLMLRLIAANAAMCVALLVRAVAPVPVSSIAYASFWTLWSVATLTLVSSVRALTDQPVGNAGLIRLAAAVALALFGAAIGFDSPPVVGLVASTSVTVLTALCTVAAWRIQQPNLRLIRSWLVGTFAIAAVITVLHVPARAIEVLQGHVEMAHTPGTYVSLLLLWIAANVGLMILVQARLAEKVAGVARTDELTGLLNRRGLNEVLAARTAEAGEAQALGAGAIVMVDIDHFKQINDRWGHDCGDQVLRWFGAQLRSHVRPADLVVRIGGEEFALVLADCSITDATARAQRICSTLADSSRFEGSQGTLRITASFGVAEYSGRPQDMKATMARADEALYAAKRAGRSAVRHWHPSTVMAEDPFDHGEQPQTLMV